MSRRMLGRPPCNICHIGWCVYVGEGGGGVYKCLIIHGDLYIPGTRGGGGEHSFTDLISLSTYQVPTHLIYKLTVFTQPHQYFSTYCVAILLTLIKIFEN